MLVYETGLLPCGGASRSTVKITLWGAGVAVAGHDNTSSSLIHGECVVQPDSSGFWSVDLVPNSDISPENTTYKIERTTGCGKIVSYINVPAEGGPYEAFTIEGDPMNSITPSALSGHAGDLDLHGGGIEIAYAEITASVRVTGTGAGFGGEMREIPGLQVVIPDLDRPIYLESKIQVSAPASTITATSGLAVRDTDTLQTMLLALDGSSIKSVPVDTSVPARIPNCIVRLPPHSAGDYSAFARAHASPYAVDIIASPLIKAWIRAVAA